ncbi:hypothetical protein CRE_22612 [Caenorhabditis remanei]|uniref:Uncharacterized protein n=1 Tax=Caenorhabditis remanei TaxID=31234 RepID=E3N8P8_CAERE|nr:hypothetical protein CRE_22612 [Caenorhabditis remanei]
MNAATPTPLSYLSIKCVLSHIDASLRLHLSSVCPAIKSVDKVVPLKISVLTFKPLEMHIDGTKYIIDVIRHLTDSKTFENVEEEFVDFWNSYEKNITADDIAIDTRGTRNPRQNFNELVAEQIRLRKEIERLQREKNFFSNSLIFTTQAVSASEAIRRLELQYHTVCERLSKFIPPPHMDYLRLSVYSEPNRTEYLESNKSAYEAMKYLIRKLIGDRKSTQIKTLNVHPSSLIVLPPQLNIKVKDFRLSTNSSAVFKSLRPIFDSSIQLQSNGSEWEIVEVCQWQKTFMFVSLYRAV